MAKATKTIHICRDCVKVELVREPENLLSIKGEPILGRCEYWTESRSVLLSWPHECDFFDDGKARGLTL